MYINEHAPKSNKVNGIHYYLLIEGEGIRRADTVDDLQTMVHQAHHNNRTIKKAARMCHGFPMEFTPETRQEESDRENRNHCQRIADEIDKYVNGKVWECPECMSTVRIPDNGGDKYKCPHCGEVFDRDDARQQDIGDYLADVLDIDYIVNYQKKYKACRILVAYGGPNIYLDTASGNVELYWWTESARHRMSSDAIEALDAWAEEYYNC